MNNLKRILSLALASVMLVGMMVVGASAAEFVDADTIANKDAVDTLVALNVINGMDPEHFVPEGNVTRAQMAKMIAVAMNGGNEEFRGSSTGSQFVDVKDGMWYVKFINYCASKGIINGRDTTHFDPEGMVTATETAVMVMRAMGYRNETFLNEKGTYSPAAVDALAEDIGLYNDTTKLDDTGVALSRQNAAQVIYNGIQLPAPEYTMSYNSEGIRTWTLKLDEKGQLTGKPMLQSKFGAEVKFAILTGTSYDSKTEKFSYTFGDDASIKEDKLTKTDLAATTIDASALFMQKVRVVYIGKDIQGISAVGKNVLSTGVWDDLAVNTRNNTWDGYQLDANLPTLEFNTNKAYSFNGYEEYALIDNDGDSKIDCVVAYPVTVAQVNSVNKTNISLVNKGSFRLDSNTVYEGAKAGDWVTVKPAVKVANVIEKLEKIENVTATAKTAADAVNHIPEYYTIGGETYVLESGVTVTVGKNPLNIVALNGHVFFQEPYTEGTAAAGIDKVVMVTRANDPDTDKEFTSDTGTTTQKVELLFADNTKKTVTVTKVDNKAVVKANDSANPAVAKYGAEVKTLYTYAVDRNGNYELTTVKTATNAAGQDTGKWNNLDEAKVTSAAAIKDGKWGTSYRFNDDAVIFGIATVEGKVQYKILTGKDVNEWDTKDRKATGVLYNTTVNGFPYAAMAKIDLGANAWPKMGASSDKYGYLTADAIEVYSAELDTNMVKLTIWTGTETVTRLATKTQVTDMTQYATGTMVKYTEAADSTLPTLQVLTTKTVAITGHDGKEIQYRELKADGTWDMANLYNDSLVEPRLEAVVIYVDDAKGTGEEASSIQLANNDPDNSDVLVANAYLLDDNGQLVLFVDINNKVYTQAKHVPVVVGSLEESKQELTKPEAGKSNKVNADSSKVITAKVGDTITYKDGQTTKTLYTFGGKNAVAGQVEKDLGLTKSTRFYLFTVTVTEAGTYKLDKTENAGTKGTANATAAEGDPAVFVVLCGNGETGTWTIKDNSDKLLYTLTWDKTAMTITAPAAETTPAG